MSVALYVPVGRSLAEAQALLERLSAEGVVPDRVAVGQELSAFVGSLEPGDALWVESLECFSGLLEVLALSGRKITIRSLSEPWFSAIPPATLEKLYDLGTFLHAARTRAGLAKAERSGRRPGRTTGFRKTYTQEDFSDVDRVDALCAAEGLSAAEACRRLGVSVYSYYRRRKLRRHRNME